jgi:hypothetical protein
MQQQNWAAYQLCLSYISNGIISDASLYYNYKLHTNQQHVSYSPFNWSPASLGTDVAIRMATLTEI